MFKRKNVFVVVCLLLAVAFLGTSFVSAAETQGHWADNYVNWAYNKGLTYADSTSKFKTEDYVTNAEFYKMVNRLAGYSLKAEISYKDVKYANWYYDDVAIAVQAGYLKDSKGALNPNAYMTRDEAARIIAQVYGLSTYPYFAAQFKDYDSIQNKGEVGALVAKKVINGYPDGSFKPQSSIKRGEAAKILYFANISLGSPKAQYEGYTGLVENTTPLYYKYYKYYGATSSEYSDLYSAINAGESKLATGLGTAAQRQELTDALAYGKSIYNNAKYYDGYYYPYGYGYDYGRIYGYGNRYGFGTYGSRHEIQKTLEASGMSSALARTIAFGEDYVNSDYGGRYYLNPSFYAYYGYFPYYDYPAHVYYDSFDGFYGAFAPYFGYDRDAAYLAWTNGYYGSYGYYGYYDGYWYGYGSEAVRAATRRINNAIAAIGGYYDGGTVWTEEIRVSFDANGGTGTMYSVDMPKGYNYTLPAVGFTAPVGKEFEAWEVAGKKFAPGTELRFYESTTVKALWKYKAIVEDKVKITFDANGGTGNMDAKEVNKGSDYPLPACEFTPPTGKEFDYWEVVGTSYHGKAGELLTVNVDYTLKAIWKNKAVVEDKVTVTLVANNDIETNVTEQVAKGSTYTLPKADKFKAPDGKEFKAWKVGTEEKAVGDKITVSADTTITAVWEDKVVVEGYKITVVGATCDKTSAKAGESVTLNLTLDPETASLQLVEIKTDANEPIVGSVDKENKTVTFTMPASNVTVTVYYSL